MTSDKKLIDTIFEIYSRLYKEAGATFDFHRLYDEVLSGRYKYINEIFGKKHRKLPKDWFMDFYLDMDRQCEIIDEVCKENKLRKRDCRIVSINVHLGCSPNSSIDTWKERVEK